MMQKSKQNALKEKPVLTTNATVKTHDDGTKSKEPTRIPSKKKLPTLLPLHKNKKGKCQ